MNRILNFHEVNNREWFDSLICMLKSKYNLISLDSLYNFHTDPLKMRNSCHITIDDGDISFYDVIFPVLKKHKVPASVYVSPKICKEKTNYWFQEIHGYNQVELKRIITDMINIPNSSLDKYNSGTIFKTLTIYQINEIIKRYKGKNITLQKQFQNMTVENLNEVAKSGLVTIGAHTLNHPILKNEDDETSKFEITESKNELSNLLGYEVKYFVYPNGIPNIDFTEREEQFLRNIDINFAFTTEPRNLSINDSVFRLPRFVIPDCQSALAVRSKLLLGSKWGNLRKLKSTSELIDRKEIAQIISTGILPEFE